MTTITETQKLTDLRQRILENERAGKPAHAGISAEELEAGLAVLRRNHVVGTSRGGATTAAKRKTAKATSVDQEKLKSLLGDLD